MSVLKNLESKIAGLVEGTFSRAFRSEVRPVEIARRLARTMDDHKTFSVSRTYVPNEYAVYLSSQDRERFADIEAGLAKELSGYLLEHARSERFTLLSQPMIDFHTDDRLRLGEFGIQPRLVQPAEPGPRPRADAPEPAPPPVTPGAAGHTMVYSTAERLRGPLEERAREREASALLVTDGRRVVVGADGAVIGRSRDCDVVLDDVNVSRRHAELRPRGSSWVLSDLGSTNGVTVNDRRLDRPQVLAPGDRLEIGTSTLTFELE